MASLGDWVRLGLPSCRVEASKSKKEKSEHDTMIYPSINRDQQIQI